MSYISDKGRAETFHVYAVPSTSTVPCLNVLPTSSTPMPSSAMVAGSKPSAAMAASMAASRLPEEKSA